MLGVFAVGVAILRAVDATETDTFSLAVVQDFEGVAVEDGDHGTGEGGCNTAGGKDQSRSEEDRPHEA